MRNYTDLEIELLNMITNILSELDVETRLSIVHKLGDLLNINDNVKKED